MSFPDLELSNYDAIIFDLGGVILPLEYGATVRELSRLLSIDASGIYTQAKQSELFNQFERGEVSGSFFRQRLLEMAGSSRHVESVQLDAAWNALLGHIPEKNVNFLRWLSKQKRTFLLSNTNEVHLKQFLKDFGQDHPQEADFGALFEKAYYSHEMGFRKPEHRIYEKLLVEHRLEPERTLFLDDKAENIEGARQLGIQAEFHPTNTGLPERFKLPANWPEDRS